MNVRITPTTVFGQPRAEVRIVNVARTNSRYEVLTEEELVELINEGMRTLARMRTMPKNPIPGA